MGTPPLQSEDFVRMEEQVRLSGTSGCGPEQGRSAPAERRGRVSSPGAREAAWQTSRAAPPGIRPRWCGDRQVALASRLAPRREMSSAAAAQHFGRARAPVAAGVPGHAGAAPARQVGREVTQPFPLAGHAWLAPPPALRGAEGRCGLGEAADVCRPLRSFPLDRGRHRVQRGTPHSAPALRRIRIAAQK